MFSWNRELTYRIHGVFLERLGEKVLLFDIRHLEILIPYTYARIVPPGDKKKYRRCVVAYKKDRTGAFGDSFYGNCFLSPSIVFTDAEKWDIGIEAVTALEPVIRLRDREELKGNIYGLLHDISLTEDIGRCTDGTD